MKRFQLLAAFCLLAVACAFASGVERRTMVFRTIGTDTLRMDMYSSEAQDAKPRPAVLFAFGGGFSGGHRDNPAYVPFFEFLAENGVVVFSTDYRTALKGMPAEQCASPQAFAQALEHAIKIAIDDYMAATIFISNRDQEFGIDPHQIIACGSSAGAITVLQSEYLLSQLKPMPFNFAGVIAMAGAICTDGAPQWNSRPCPMMLFHGDADSTVPFDKVAVGSTALRGANDIAAELTRMNVPHEFYKICGKGHEVAESPMNDFRYEILGFIHNYAIGRKNAILNAVQTVPGVPKDYRTDFTLEDYLRSNMPSN